MLQALRKMRWEDAANLVIGFAFVWLFYFLLSPENRPNSSSVFLSGLSFWTFMAWIYDLRKYGLEPNLGTVGWIASILGGFAAYGCLFGAIAFMVSSATEIDASRSAPFLTAALVCLVYGNICLFTVWTRFKVGANFIAIQGSRFYWPGEQIRIYPFRAFTGTLLNRNIPVFIQALQLECADGTFTVNVDTLVEVPTDEDRLRLSSGASIYTNDYLRESASGWVGNNLKSLAMGRTLGQLLQESPGPQSLKVDFGLPMKWSQRPNIQLTQ